MLFKKQLKLFTLIFLLAKGYQPIFCMGTDFNFLNTVADTTLRCALAGIAVKVLLEKLNSNSSKTGETRGSFSLELSERLVIEVPREINDGIQLLKQGKKCKKMFILAGPPGTGKTSLAHKIAAEVKTFSFDVLVPGDINSMFLGVDTAKIRNFFSEALSKSKQGPVVVFIDEIDVFAQKRGEGNPDTAVNQEEKRKFHELHHQLEQVALSDTPILVLGATNLFDSIDPAIARMFTRVEIPLPNKMTRRVILENYIKRAEEDGIFFFDQDRLLDNIADQTFGLSGAHLENLVEAAISYPKKTPLNIVSQRDFEQVLRQLLVSLGRISVSEEENKITRRQFAGEIPREVKDFLFPYEIRG